MNMIKQVIDTDQINIYNQTVYSPILLPKVQDKSVVLDFNGGLISSDAGILFLKEIEEQIGLIKAIEKVIATNNRIFIFVLYFLIIKSSSSYLVNIS